MKVTPAIAASDCANIRAPGADTYQQDLAAAKGIVPHGFAGNIHPDRRLGIS